MANPVFGNAGSYGEGAVIDRFNYLKTLKSKLDNGSLSVQDYLAQAQPLAKETLQTIGSVAGKGSKAASIVNPYISQLSDVGFKVNPNGEILPDLGQKYESQLRGNILPGNTPADQRQGIAQIPEDIPLTSDRGQIEREATREQSIAQSGLDSQTAYRSGALKDLAGLLSGQASDNFKRSIPQIAEDSNSAGVFRSSGYGNALAQKQSELQSGIANQIGQQGYQNSLLTAAGMGDITDARISGAQSGLQRQLSLQDFAANRTTAQQFADANKPQPQGKTGTEKAVQGVQLGLAGANTAGQIGKAGKK